MRKLTVLTAFVFLFGLAGLAVAGEDLEVNGNDLVGAKGGQAAAANDQSIAANVDVDVNKNVNVEKEVNVDIEKDVKVTKVKAEGEGNAVANNGSTANAIEIDEQYNINVDARELHVAGESPTTSTNNSVGAVGNESIGSNSAGAKYDSDNTEVTAEAENGSIAAINTTGDIKLDKSTHISISDIGLAIQKTELEGKVEDNKLIVGGPDASSFTMGGKAYSGKAESGKAESEAKAGDGGFAISVSKAKSGFAGAAAFGESESGNKAETFGGAASGSAAGDQSASSVFDDAEAKAESESKALSANGALAKDGDSKNKSEAEGKSGSAFSASKADADGGSARSDDAKSGKAKSGDAYAEGSTAAPVRATTTFYTGNNNFTTGSFNGVGVFNVNSGINSLNQSQINVNAVVGGNALAR